MKLRRIHTNTENLESEDDASILLSMCTSAPHLDVSIRCKVDAELEEECAVIAWKMEELDEDDSGNGEDEEDQDESDDVYEDSDNNQSWHTETDDEESHESSDEEDAASETNSDNDENDSKSSQSSDEDDSSATSVSSNQLWDEYLNDPDNRPQYLFEVDRDRVLESSLNSLESMSKWAPNAYRRLCDDI